MAVRQDGRRNRRGPLDEKGLEEAALQYAGRFATSRMKLASYLHRKLRERGWAGAADPPVEALVERMVSLGYVDDRGFAAARAASLSRRGYGERRVAQALQAAGIEAEDKAEAEAISRSQALAAALRFARRRRIGPFAEAVPDRPAREKAMAALLRAGHPMAIARLIVQAKPEDFPELDSQCSFDGSQSPES